MTIWRIRTDIEYRSLAYDNEFDARKVRLYERGDLPTWSPVFVGYATDAYPDFDPKRAPIPSFPALSSSIACGKSARTVLDKLVRDHVDFLPLASNTITDEQYYILYPKTVLDCLDKEKSIFASTRSGYIKGVKRYVFESDCIGDTPMFRLPIAGSSIGEPYVNDKFKQLVEENKLTGLKFSKVWDG